MTRRIYIETVKIWAKRIGIPLGTIGTMIGLVFLFLSMSGAITITGFSGDTVCAGNFENPCYAYINMTANEDIFLYPLENYDPWGRETPFEFEPALKSWKLQRSWGSGWRDIPLNKTCTGTWCGAPNSDGVKYSYVFREDRDYQLRIVGYKNDPYEDIKWAINYENREYLDPTWEGIPTGSFIDSIGLNWGFSITEDPLQEVNLEMFEVEDGIFELTLTEHENSSTPNNYRWNMALCNNESTNVRYMEADNQGSFEWIDWELVQYGNVIDEGMNETWCEGGDAYTLFSSGSKNQFPKRFRLDVSNLTEFKLYAGSGSILVDGNAVSDATAYQEQNNMCKTPNGKTHFFYQGGGSDFWYGNSTDDISFTIRELLAGTITYPGIVCMPNGDIIGYYMSGSDLDMFKSTDDGASFTGPTTVEDDVATLLKGAAAPDENSIAHWCVVDTSDDLVYVNSSSLDQGKEIRSADTDHCDIELDSANQPHIIISEDATDDLDIMRRVDGSWSTQAIKNNMGSVNAQPQLGISISINDEDNIDISGIFATDLWLCHGVWSSWTCLELDSTNSYNPNIAVSNANEVFIRYQEGTLIANNMFLINSSNRTSFQLVRTVGTSGYGSMATFNWDGGINMQDTLYSLYTDNSDLYADNLTIQIPVTYLLNITSPTTENTLTVSNSSNETFYFNITGDDGSNIESDVAIVNITINGELATILSSSSSADTGETAVGTGANVDRSGNTAWGNPTRITTSDNSYSNWFDTAGDSDWLRGTNLGFDIPSGATIDGIIVKIHKKASTSPTSIKDDALFLRKTSGQVGDNKANTVDAWSESEFIETYGDSSDDWNAGLSAEDINSADFGVELSIVNIETTRGADVDYMTIQVYYTADSQEFAHNGTSWVVNVTVPNIVDGTYDLFINATFAGTTYNETESSSVIYGAPPADSCSPSSPLSANHLYDCSDDCTISSNLDAGGFNISFDNTGVFVMEANITNIGKRIIYDNTCDIREYTIPRFYHS